MSDLFGNINLNVNETLANVNLHVEESHSHVPMSVEPVKVVSNNDYEKLLNKPKINGVTLLGNMETSELFSQGIILDGGDASE